MSCLNEAALLRAGDLIKRRDELLVEHMDAKIQLAVIESELKQVERERQAQLQATFGGVLGKGIPRADKLAGGE